MSDSRCPQCAAIVRPDARWCSLCHAALGADPRVALADVPAVPADVVDQVSSGHATPGAERPRGRHAKGRVTSGSTATVQASPPVELTDLELAALGLLNDQDPDGQLAMFDDAVSVDRIDLSLLADRPVVSGRWSALASNLDSNGAKAMVMAGGAVLVAAVLFGLLTLVGLIFT